MKTLTAEEVETKRLALLVEARQSSKKLFQLDKIWQAKLVEVGRIAVLKFRQNNEKSFMEAKVRLEDERDKINDKLDELKHRCPNNSAHRKPKGKCYYCPTCGYLWDDISPAHP